MDVGADGPMVSARKTGPPGGVEGELVVGDSLVCVALRSGLPNFPGTDGTLVNGNLEYLAAQAHDYGDH